MRQSDRQTSEGRRGSHALDGRSYHQAGGRHPLQIQRLSGYWLLSEPHLVGLGHRVQHASRPRVYQENQGCGWRPYGMLRVCQFPSHIPGSEEYWSILSVRKMWPLFTPFLLLDGLRGCLSDIGEEQMKIDSNTTYYVV